MTGEDARTLNWSFTKQIGVVDAEEDDMVRLRGCGSHGIQCRRQI